MSIQTNGICERFHKTILQKFYQVAFRNKLYDSIDVIELIKRGKELNYPPRILALGLQMHMAPRMLRASFLVIVGVGGEVSRRRRRS